ncbi:MAG: heavy metal translocating P-type ATPase [Oscillospiraceae bacterium]|nr:heavy metal translocating P-type ATPase [Oscillospiraceae bacterium]
MTKKQKCNLYRILASAALLVAALLIPAEGTLRLALFLVPYFVVGWDVLWSAVRNIARGSVFDENFLMGLATVGAWFVGEYPEAVAVMLFYQVGELFQSIAVGRSRRSIAALMDIRPEQARVLRGGRELDVAPEEVAVGECVVVRPGEKFPLDGIVAEGATTVNTAALTGESLPRDCAEGDNVVSGSVNLTSAVKVRVTSVYADSTVAKILDLVENSSSRKARAENFITRFARWYTPSVVAAAAVLAVAPPLLLHGAWSEWIRRALIFLVVSCPCALVISVPLSFFGGIGGASRRGILIKGSNYLESLSKVRTVAFDKTGTLTQGSFTVTAVHPKDMSEAELLDIAALAESGSNHPIAQSILRAHGGHIDQSRIGAFEERAGFGICAVIDGAAVYAGNGLLMDEAGAQWHECHKTGTVIHVAKGSEYCGHIVISDEVKPDAADAIAQLRALGVRRTVMLTGDVEAVGRAVGRELGLDEVRAGLLPDGKISAVEDLLGEKPKGTALAFVGDGINDAPVLMRADVGIAMGALGSDAAIEAADVVLMDDKPTKVAEAVRIAERTMRIVRENIAFALAVKAVVLVLGALGLAGMWVAVFADVGVSVLAILNAMRALRTE